MEFPLGQGHGVIRTLSVQAKTGVVLVGGGERAIAFYPMPVEKRPFDASCGAWHDRSFNGFGACSRRSRIWRFIDRRGDIAQGFKDRGTAVSRNTCSIDPTWIYKVDHDE